MSIGTHSDSPQTLLSAKTWVRKKEGEYVLAMLDKLDLLQGTPRAFDALIADRRYLAAVTRLDQAIGAMFR